MLAEFSHTFLFPLILFLTIGHYKKIQMVPPIITGVVPRDIRSGDKIRVSGTIKPNAKEFSINFVNGNSPSDDITYHFDWRLKDKLVVQNWKSDGAWMAHHRRDYPPFDGVKFSLEFSFQDQIIYVYMVHEEGYNLITGFIPTYEFSDIKTVQVWGDVDKITELNFAFPLKYEQ